MGQNSSRGPTSVFIQINPAYLELLCPEGSHLEMDVWYKDVRVVVGLAEPKQRGRQLAMRHLNEDQGVKLSMARGAKQLKRAREHSSSQALSRLSRPFAGQYQTMVPSAGLPACLCA